MERRPFKLGRKAPSFSVTRKLAICFGFPPCCAIEMPKMSSDTRRHFFPFACRMPGYLVAVFAKSDPAAVQQA